MVFPCAIRAVVGCGLMHPILLPSFPFAKTPTTSQRRQHEAAQVNNLSRTSNGRMTPLLRGLRIKCAYQRGPHGLNMRGSLGVDLQYTALQHFHLEAERIKRSPLVAPERLDGLPCQDDRLLGEPALLGNLCFFHGESPLAQCSCEAPAVQASYHREKPRSVYGNDVGPQGSRGGTAPYGGCGRRQYENFS
jgi:hypothetical protein